MKNSTEKALALVKAYKDGDRMALDELFAIYEPLARKVVAYYTKRVYSSPMVSEEDMMQEAAIGMIEALDKFSFEKGCALSSYLEEGMKIAIRRYLSSNIRIVRIPKHIIEKLSKVEKVISSSNDMDFEQACLFLGFSGRDMKNIAMAYSSQFPTSLDTAISEEGDETICDLLSVDSFEDNFLRDDEMRSLLECIESLGEGEKILFTSFYGLFGKEKKTVEELSLSLSLSDATIMRRISEIKKGIRKSFVA